MRVALLALAGVAAFLMVVLRPAEPVVMPVTTCVANFEWNDTLYLSTGVRVRPGAKLGTGRARCAGEDLNSEPVFRVPSVAPALATTDTAGRIYMPIGFAVQLRSHPLHARYAQLSRDREAKRCGARRPLTVILRTAPSAGTYLIGVTAGEREVLLGLRPDAAVHGVTERNGLPFFEEGDVLLLRGRTCQTEEDGPRFMADRITGQGWLTFGVSG